MQNRSKRPFTSLALATLLLALAVGSAFGAKHTEQYGGGPITVSYLGARDNEGGSGLSLVELWVRKSADEPWVYTELQRVSPEPAGSFEFDAEAAGGDGVYYFAFVAQDRATNRSPLPTGEGHRVVTYSTGPAPDKPALDAFGSDDGWDNIRNPRFLHDVNGDGLDDLIGFGDENVQVALAAGDRTFLKPETWSDAFSAAAGWDFSRDQAELNDANGDGLADIVAFGAQGVIVALSDGSKFGDARLVLQDFGPDQDQRSLADVDGDRLDDILGFGDAGVLVALSLGDGAYAPPALWAAAEGLSWNLAESPARLGDLNGDGRADIAAFGQEGVYVALSKGSSFAPETLGVAYYGSGHLWEPGRHPRLLADVNGDGLADLAGFADAGVYVSLSTGDGMFSQPLLWTGGFGAEAGWSHDRDRVELLDFDSDGQADIVGYGPGGVYIALSGGDRFVHAELWVANFGSDQGWSAETDTRESGYIDGDALIDFVGFGDEGVFIY